MDNLKLKYDLPIDSYPLRKMQELFPITNDMVIVVSGIPISDEYSDFLLNTANLQELCKKFNKDLILGVNIHFEPADDDEEDYDYDDEDYDEYDEDEDYYGDEDDDDDLFSRLSAENLNCGIQTDNRYYNEQYYENGFAYNFSKIFPESTDDFGNPIYSLYDGNNEDGIGLIYNKDASDEIVPHIDQEGENWMFTFSFRHPIAIQSDLQYPRIITKETAEYADKIMYSLMDIMHDGVSNIVETDSMKLIIGAMRDTAISGDRVPFIGTVGCNLYINNMNDDLRYSYAIWTKDLYNKLLDDYVEYESKVSPPILMKTDMLWFKPTDFLGQYYLPHGIKIRKEEKKNGRRKEGKKNSSKSEKASCKENNKKSSP